MEGHTISGWWNRAVGCHHRASMRSRKHKLGGRCIVGKNLFPKGQLAIWKGLPKGFDIGPYLIAPMECDSSRKDELNVWLLISEIVPKTVAFY